MEEISVTRFVCGLVHGAPPSEDYQAAHSCGNGHLYCVNWKHISWKTPKQNREDQYVHGTNSNKLTANDVLEIGRLIKSNMPMAQIRHRFNISSGQLRRIRSRENWGWLSDDYEEEYGEAMVGKDLFK
jgi:hypothetical protein